MTLLALSSFLAAASPNGASGQAPPPWVNIVPLVLIMVVFYFILIRPQQKKAREHTDLLKTLKPGDKVVTSGGVLGVIVSVKEKSVSLRSADTKLEVLKSAVSEITERSSAASQP
jgi:preprotein translocase subunit YajC